MKSKITTILILILMLGLTPINFSNAASLATKLKGKILLQVESNGEAWYVNPENEKRYYLGRPSDAFQVMRELGLGISNNDFNSFNGYAPSGLSGKILLKVEDNGKAYYVNPTDLKMHYLGKPEDAFQIMRELGLGISNNDLNSINTDGDNQISTNNSFDPKSAIAKISCHSADYNIWSFGSGVLVHPSGIIITNRHVVLSEDFITNAGGSAKILTKFICNAGLITDNNYFEPDHFFDIEIISTNKLKDIAIAKIVDNQDGYYANNFPYLKIDFNSNIGQTVKALGFPDVANGNLTTTEGKVTSYEASGKDCNLILSDVSASYGNSGGALINSDNELLGINTKVSISELYHQTYSRNLSCLKDSYNTFYKLSHESNPNGMSDETVSWTFSEIFNLDYNDSNSKLKLADAAEKISEIFKLNNLSLDE